MKKLLLTLLLLTPLLLSANEPTANQKDTSFFVGFGGGVYRSGEIDKYASNSWAMSFGFDKFFTNRLGLTIIGTFDHLGEGKAQQQPSFFAEKSKSWLATAVGMGLVYNIPWQKNKGILIRFAPSLYSQTIHNKKITQRGGQYFATQSQVIFERKFNFKGVSDTHVNLGLGLSHIWSPNSNFIGTDTSGHSLSALLTLRLFGLFNLSEPKQK